MKQQLIDKLWWPTHYIAGILGTDLDIGGDWNNWEAKPGVKELELKKVDQGTIRFTLPGTTSSIEISDVRPTKISKTVYGEAQQVNTQVKDAYISKAENASHDMEMERTYSVSEGRESSEAIDVGASVTAGISQSISYGGELSQFKGETSVSLEISASFNKNWTYGKSTERTVDTTITLPPRTRSTLTTSRSSSTLKQDITYWADLDFTIKFGSTDVYGYQIDSIQDLFLALDGDGYPGLFRDIYDFGQGHVDNRMFAIQGRSDWYHIKDIVPITTEFTKSISFDSAQSGTAVLTSEEIK